jgi:hypothetical protein
MISKLFAGLLAAALSLPVVAEAPKEEAAKADPAKAEKKAGKKSGKKDGKKASKQGEQKPAKPKPEGC